MARLDWSRARRWRSAESISRPVVVTARMRSFDAGRRGCSPPAQPALPLPSAAAPAVTLSHLAGSGFNMISAWCPSCRVAMRMPFASLAPEFLTSPIDDLGGALGCPDCGGSRTVSPFAERVVRSG